MHPHMITSAHMSGIGDSHISMRTSSSLSFDNAIVSGCGRRGTYNVAYLHPH